MKRLRRSAVLTIFTWFTHAAIAVPTSTTHAGDIAVLEQASNGHVAQVQAILPRLRKPALRDVAEMILAADHGRDGLVRKNLACFIALGDKEPRLASVAWSVAANSAFAAGDYTTAAREGDEWLHALSLVPPSQTSTDAVNLRSTAAALAKLPSQRLLSRTSHLASTRRDQAGLLRADILVNDIAQSAVLDTGANLSTVSLSAARRLGIHVLEGGASVSSSTRATVKVRVGYAERIELAGVRFANVAFLVLDDDQLAVPITGYKLDTILGFPIFRAMGRVRLAEGSFQPFSPPTQKAHTAALHFNGSSMFVAVTVGGRAADLQLDSGAPSTSPTAAFAVRNPDLVAQLARHTSHQAGAGGTTEIEEAILPDATIRLDSCSVKLPRLSIGTGSATPGASDGPLGQDVLRHFSAHTIDFIRSVLELEGGKC